MRIRSIKPEFYKHDGLAALEPITRILFTGLWCMADSAGRLEDRPKRIKAEVLPYDTCDIEAMLAELALNGFITRYEVAGDHFIEIPAFSRHQRITGKEATAESRFPSFSGSKRATKGKHPRNNGETPEKQPESLEGKGKETEGKGDDVSPSIPDSLKTPAFEDAWERYLAYRRSSKLKALALDSVSLRMKELEHWGPEVAIAAINRTIANGWQGIFPEREKNAKAAEPRKSFAEEDRDKARRETFRGLQSAPEGANRQFDEIFNQLGKDEE
jgi:hypothetical protein